MLTIEQLVSLQLLPAEAHPDEILRLRTFMKRWDGFDSFTQRKYAKQYQHLNKQWQHQLPVLTNSLLIAFCLAKSHGDDIDGFNLALRLIAETVISRSAIDSDLIANLCGLVDQCHKIVITERFASITELTFARLNISVAEAQTTSILSSQLTELFRLLSDPEVPPFEGIFSENTLSHYYNRWYRRLKPLLEGQNRQAVLNYSLNGKDIAIHDLAYLYQFKQKTLLHYWDYGKLSLSQWSAMLLVPQLSDWQTLLILNFIGVHPQVLTHLPLVDKRLQQLAVLTREPVMGAIRKSRDALRRLERKKSNTTDKGEKVTEPNELEVLALFFPLKYLFEQFGHTKLRLRLLDDNVTAAYQALSKHINRHFGTKDLDQIQPSAEIQEITTLADSIERRIDGSFSLCVIRSLFFAKSVKPQKLVMLLCKKQDSQISQHWYPQQNIAAIMMTHQEMLDQVQQQGSIYHLFEAGAFYAILAEFDAEIEGMTTIKFQMKLSSVITMTKSPQDLAKKYCQNRYYHLLYGNEEALDEHTVIRNADSLASAMKNV